MKSVKKSGWRPLLSLVCGVAGLGLHQLLYLLAVDEKNLLVAGHPVQNALWLLSIGVCVFAAVSVRNLGGAGEYEENFPKSVTAAGGQVFFGASILLTVLFWEPAMAGAIGLVWKWLGLLAFLMLMWAGYSRMEGKQPCFVTHMVLCAYLAIHIVTHYRTWSGDPQLLDYVFTLLGFISLMVFAYCQTSFDVGFPRRRLLLASGLLAVYLVTVSLPDTPYWLLNLGGIIWVCTNFCTWEAPAAKESVE